MKIRIALTITVTLLLTAGSNAGLIQNTSGVSQADPTVFTSVPDNILTETRYDEEKYLLPRTDKMPTSRLALNQHICNTHDLHKMLSFHLTTSKASLSFEGFFAASPEMDNNTPVVVGLFPQRTSALGWLLSAYISKNLPDTETIYGYCDKLLSHRILSMVTPY